MAADHRSDERRRNIRIPFGSMVTLQADGAAFECRARDLGLGGLLIYVDNGPLPAIESIVGIHFRLGDASESIELRGKIVRHDGSPTGVGLAFVEISDRVREALQAYISEQIESTKSLDS